jgi:hypothetical protein
MLTEKSDALDVLQTRFDALAAARTRDQALEVVRLGDEFEHSEQLETAVREPFRGLPRVVREVIFEKVSGRLDVHAWNPGDDWPDADEQVREGLLIDPGEGSSAERGGSWSRPRHRGCAGIARLGAFTRIQCPAGADNSSCLTPAQVTVVRDFYLGPNDGHGHYLYPGGEPYGSELAWAGVAVDPAADTNWPEDTFAHQIGTTYLKYMGYWQNPPASFRLSGFRFTRAAYDKLLPLAGVYDATDPDLSAFRQAGGKLIIYQGWDDQKISPFGTVDYYKAAVQDAGGFAASQAFTRLYMIPGQYHCLTDGSPAVDVQQAKGELLNSLMKWVEQGTVPRTFSFPLAQPTAKLSAITVHPLNPLSPPPGGARGLNTQYHWVGQFRPGGELWCSTQRMDLVCDHHQPPISYTASKAGIAASSQ